MRDWMARKRLNDNNSMSMRKVNGKTSPFDISRPRSGERTTRSQARRLRAYWAQQPSSDGKGSYVRESSQDGKGKGKGKQKGKNQDGKGKTKGQKGRDEKGKTSKGKGKGKDGGKGSSSYQNPGAGAAARPPSAPGTPRSRVQRDANGVPVAKLDDAGNRLNLCWWFQSLHNGGQRCPRKQNECMFIHSKCKDGEFQHLKKPTGHSPAPKSNPASKTAAKPKPKRAGSPGPKAKAHP